MKRFPTLLAPLLLATGAYAASPTATARIEPDSIGIGDRFDVVIDVDRDLVQVVEFPTFTPDPRSGLETVTSHPVDTLSRDGRRLRLRKRYTLAAFEEGEFRLAPPPVLYLDKNITDTLPTGEPLELQVGTFRIDSTSRSIYDLKGQRTLPFRYGEIGGYVAWGLVGTLLLAALLYAGYRIRKRYGRRIGDLFRPSPPLPPHVAAIRALEALRARKLWQSGRCKQYYSELTDILRTYLAERYDFGAREMTSDEILREIRRRDLPKRCTTDLHGILREADMVKFAKAEPDAEQNEANYSKAYDFVEQTKPAEDPANSTPQEENR